MHFESLQRKSNPLGTIAVQLHHSRSIWSRSAGSPRLPQVDAERIGFLWTFLRRKDGGSSSPHAATE